MSRDNTFLKQKTNYKTLYAYRKAECIYDITYFFVHHFLEKSDRTIDQMLQAARSGKQNIAEGYVAGVTSKKTEIMLTNVAKASLHELKIDYEDYLRVRGLKQWSSDDESFQCARQLFSKQNDSAYYRKLILTRPADTIANLAIILIAQTDFLLFRRLEFLKKEYLTTDSLHKEMTRARRNQRH